MPQPDVALMAKQTAHASYATCPATRVIMVDVPYSFTSWFVGPANRAKLSAVFVPTFWQTHLAHAPSEHGSAIDFLFSFADVSECN